MAEKVKHAEFIVELQFRFMQMKKKKLKYLQDSSKGLE